VQILGSKFWALGSLNQKSKKKHFCRVPHGELTAKKWLDSIDKQKRRSNLKERDKWTKNNRLLARRGDQQNAGKSSC